MHLTSTRRLAFTLMALLLGWVAGSQAGSHSARSPRFTVDTRAGEITVSLEPAGARSAGARWRLDGGAWRASGVTLGNVTMGGHTVEFSNITGWNRPGNQRPDLPAGGELSLTGTYTAAGASTGTLTGTVSVQDAQGRPLGPLSGATVAIVGGPSTGTDAQGGYTFTGLAPASYSVTASKAGYNAVSRTVMIAAGVTRTESFSLAQQAGTPVAYDARSSRGNHLIEGMPGELSFEATVAWNGSPGTVRFLLAGVWRSATLADLGGGLARATLAIAAPATIASTSEWTVEVRNGAGLQSTLRTGVYFYPTPAVMRRWYQGSLLWRATGGNRIGVSQALSVTLWEIDYDEVLSSEAGYSESLEIRFDPRRGEFEAEREAAGSFSATLEFDHVENMGEGDIGLSGSLSCGLRGFDPPAVEGALGLDITGKAGVKAPAAQVVAAAFPPAAPFITTLRRTPVVKDVVDSLRLGLYLSAGLGVEGTWSQDDGSCWLGADAYEVSGTIGAEATASLEAWKAKVGIYVGGSGTPTLQVCPEWAFQGVTLRGYIGVFASAWLFEYRREVGWETTLWAPEGSKALGLRLLGDLEPEGKWRPLGDDFLQWGEGYRLAARAAKGLATTATAGGGEETILENVTALAVPALLVDGAGELVLFAQQDTGKPWYQATDIGQVSRPAGGAWALARLTDDDAAEFGPGLAPRPAASAVAAWTRAEGDLSGAEDPGDVVPHLEIVAAVQDRVAGTWSAPVQLTDNALVDRAPLPVAFGSAEGILWVQNAADAALGDAARGDRLLYAPRNGDGWDAPGELWSGAKGIVSVVFVADAAGEGHIVFVVDEDGDPETQPDRELYAVATQAGVWQTAVRLTSDAVEDAFPVLLAPGGEPLCVWRSGDALRYSSLAGWNPRDLFSGGPAVAIAPTLAGVTLPGGGVVAYAVQVAGGTDILAAFYDAALDRWSRPRQLTHDDHTETSLAMAEDAGELVIAYLKTRTLRTDMDIEIGGTVYPVPNVPQPGRIDLCILRYAAGLDLGLRDGSLRVDPANPAPGSTAEVWVTLGNYGETPVSDVALALYDGDPADGGTLAGTALVPGPLVGGDAVEVSFTWAVPADPNSHRLFAVVDPDLVLDDRDRANNTAAVWAVLPDLVVEASSSQAVSATTVVLTARVANAGTVPSGGFAVSWRLGSPGGAEIGRVSGDGLDAGGPAFEGALVWDAGSAGLQGSFATVYAVADPDDAVQEQNEGNNQRAQSVQIAYEPGDHLVVFGTDETPGATLEGRTVQAVSTGGDCTGVRAVPPPDRRFTAWRRDDGVPYTDNPLVVTGVTADLSFTAEFAPKLEQTISFAPPAPKTCGDADFAHGATATSGLPVTVVSSDAAVAQVVGGTVHIVGAGVCTLTATQAGDGTWRPAPPVARTLSVAARPGDFYGPSGNADGQIDGQDLGFFAEQWFDRYGTPDLRCDIAPYAPPEDPINGVAAPDGRINGQDLGRFAALWDLRPAPWGPGGGKARAVALRGGGGQPGLVAAGAGVAAGVEIGVEATTLAGEPVSAVPVGGEFLAVLRVRENTARAGLALAACSVVFPPGQVAAVGFDPETAVDGGVWSFRRGGGLDAAGGRIDDLYGATLAKSVADGAFVRLATVRFRVLAPGSLTIRTEATAGEVLALFGGSIASSPSYGAVTLEGTSDGSLLAVVDAAAVAAGRGWWDLSGTYATVVAGKPLALALVHDAAGRLSGTATWTVASEATVTMPIVGCVRGTSGSLTMKGALKGADPGRTVSVALAVALAVDTAKRQIEGTVTGSLRSGGVTTVVNENLVLDIPAPMDGTWTLALDLDQSGTTVSGTALLTFSNGVDYTFAVKGKTGANGTAVLALAGAATDAAAKAIKIKTAITPLVDGWARIDAFSGKGYGQALGW